MFSADPRQGDWTPLYTCKDLLRVWQTQCHEQENACLAEGVEKGKQPR